MSLFIRLIAAALIGLVASGIFTGIQTGSGFAIAANSATAFVLTALLTAVICQILPKEFNISLPKASGKREQGKVKWFNFNKGFGFITRDAGGDIFVHYRNIRGGKRRGLREGQRVEFVVTQGDKGDQADDVEVLG